MNTKKKTHFVPKNPPFWRKMYQNTPRLKCTQKPPKMYQKTPGVGTFWGVVQGVFWYILVFFPVHFGGWVHSGGVLWYIFGQVLVQIGGFCGAIRGGLWAATRLMLGEERRRAVYVSERVHPYYPT